ncbi:MAG: Clamp-binding protein CrfC [Chroococcopsis gigantea SAG 12.99]|nr:Clamp-binding protein CrfC [Chroococcopsis gigantea SAG 12.99]
MNIQSLQDYIMSLLEKIKTGEDQEQINEQIKLVKYLELKMVITAPMKAGKSTFLNAIIGQEILPIHDKPMTTMPTNVVLDPQLTQPILRLDQKTFHIFNEAIKNLQTQTLQWTEQQKKYRQSSESLKAILGGFQLKIKTTGSGEISQTLKILNHLIRLCNEVEDCNRLQSITHFPCLEVPFKMQTNLSQSGKLVIVDTPGSNEAGRSELRNLVNNQLGQSALVLLIIDFTHIGSNEEYITQSQVKEIIDLRGNSNLYVVVNKYDQRQLNSDNSLQEEEEQEDVRTRYKLSCDHKVFLVSAQKELYANSLLGIMENHPQMSIDKLREIQSTRNFAEKYYGAEWEDRLNNLTKEKLRTAAENFKKASGFSTLLQQVFALLKDTEHTCMRTAVNIGSNSLNKLNNEWSSEINMIRDLHSKLLDEIEISTAYHNELRRNINAASEQLRQQHKNWSHEINEVRRLYCEISLN